MTTPKFPGRPRFPVRTRVRAARTALGSTVGGPPPRDPHGNRPLAPTATIRPTALQPGRAAPGEDFWPAPPGRWAHWLRNRW